MMKESVFDIHTHRLDAENAVISLSPTQIMQMLDTAILGKGSAKVLPLSSSAYYSLSLHPWHITPSDIAYFDQLCEQQKQDSQFYAIGECGLDTLCETPFDLQQKAFVHSLQRAKELHKPVIIHCVKSLDTMLHCVKQVWGEKGAVTAYKHGSKLIIHGFRKGPALAQQLLNVGYCLSLGEHFNKDVPNLIPNDKIFIETDESDLKISEIKEKVYLCRT